MADIGGRQAKAVYAVLGPGSAVFELTLTNNNAMVAKHSLSSSSNALVDLSLIHI